jgi:hypothetical protein
VYTNVHLADATDPASCLCENPYNEGRYYANGREVEAILN